MPPPQISDETEAAWARAHLDAICESGDFPKRGRMRALLTYLVEARLSANESRVKAYAIGVDVLGRPDDFDPNSDSIVRVQVGRLRKHLVYYYLTEGKNETRQFDLPRGSYALDFIDAPTRSEPPELRPKAPGLPHAQSRPSGMSGQSVVGFLPFSNIGDASGNDLCVTLADDLRMHVAKVDGLAALRLCDIGADEAPCDFYVRGTVRHAGHRVRVHLELLAATLETVWAGNFTQDVGDDVFAAQDHLLETLLMDLRLRIVNAVRAPWMAQPPEVLNPWQKYMVSVFAPDRRQNSYDYEMGCVRMLENTIIEAPMDARAHAALAEKLAYLANIHSRADTPEALERAALLHRRAQDLSTTSADVMFNLSLYHWHRGDIRQALRATRRTLELEPYHPLARIHEIGMPVADRIPDLWILDKLKVYESRFSRDNPARWVALSWIMQMHINRSEYDRAEEYGLLTQETYSTPETRLRLAAVLVQLGREQEARDQIDDYVDLWPDLDVIHYATKVVPRRFGDGMVGRELERIYRDLARVLGTKRPFSVVG